MFKLSPELTVVLWIAGVLFLCTLFVVGHTIERMRYLDKRKQLHRDEEEQRVRKRVTLEKLAEQQRQSREAAQARQLEQQRKLIGDDVSKQLEKQAQFYEDQSAKQFEAFRQMLEEMTPRTDPMPRPWENTPNGWGIEAVKLYHEGKTDAEIAQVVGKDSKTVSNNLSQWRKEFPKEVPERKRKSRGSSREVPDG